jgi:hypothetical protein
MTYRRSANTYDAWVRYRDEHSSAYAAIGLPVEVLQSEQQFVDFLTAGYDPDTGFSLDTLSDEQYWKLFYLVTTCFDMRASEFTACEKRRLRKGGRSG